MERSAPPYARPPCPLQRGLNRDRGETPGLTPKGDYMTEPDNLIEAPKSPNLAGVAESSVEAMIAAGKYTEEEADQLRGFASDLSAGMQSMQDAMDPFIGLFDARLEAQEKALQEILVVLQQQEKDLQAFETWAKDTFRKEVAESFLEFADLCERHGMHIPEHWRANLQKVAGQ